MNLRFVHSFYSGFGISHPLRLVGSPFFHTGVLKKTASDVLVCPSAFSTGSFPPFYRALLAAWQEMDGSFCVVHLLSLPLHLLIMFALCFA